MSIAGEIRLILRDLNIEWFLTKKKRFEEHPDYKKDLGFIYHEFKIEDLEDVENLEELRNIKLFKEAKFELFCWHDDDTHPYLEESHDHEEGDLEDGDWFADQIVEFLKETLPLQDTITSYATIKASIVHIEEALMELKTRDKNSDYHFILDNFLLETVSYIWRKFSLVEEMYSIHSSYADKLQFNLDQVQLAALAFLLWNAGFVKDDPKNLKKYFYSFCRRHFEYFNTDTFKYSPPKDLSKKFSDIKTGANSAALQKVFEDLEKAYKKA